MSLTQMLFSKTAWAAFGLVCYAIYLATTEQYQQAVEVFLAALAAFGIRDAIAKK